MRTLATSTIDDDHFQLILGYEDCISVTQSFGGMAGENALRDLTVDGLQRGYSTGKTTPTQICLDLHRKICESENIFIDIPSVESVIRRCEEIESIPQEQRGVLYGVPFAVKDNIDVAGYPTTAACPSFSYQATRGAKVVEAVLREGAVYMGKVNLDQFACGLVGTRSPYGIPPNRYHKGLVPGGSSSGSAVAVAAGLCSFAFGTDTAGSGRVPAGLNGIVGMKPSVGLCSTMGVVPACRSLDCPSVFALNVQDGRKILKLIENNDPYDSSWRPRIKESKEKMLGDAGFAFAVLETSFLRFDGPGGDHVKQCMMSCYEDASIKLEKIGGRRVDIDFSPFEKIASLLYEGAFVAERYQGIRAFLEGDEHPKDSLKDISRDNRMLLITRKIIDNTRQYSSADVFGSMEQLDRIKALARQELDRIDVLLVPTAAYHYTIKEILEQEEQGIGSLNANLGRFTNFVNFLGMCGISVPSGTFNCNLNDRIRTEDGDGSDATIPFGVTLLGKPWEDDFVGAIATKFTGF